MPRSLPPPIPHWSRRPIEPPSTSSIVLPVLSLSSAGSTVVVPFVPVPTTDQVITALVIGSHVLGTIGLIGVHGTPPGPHRGVAVAAFVVGLAIVPIWSLIGVIAHLDDQGGVTEDRWRGLALRLGGAPRTR